MPRVKTSTFATREVMDIDRFTGQLKSPEEVGYRCYALTVYFSADDFKIGIPIMIRGLPMNAEETKSDPMINSIAVTAIVEKLADDSNFNVFTCHTFRRSPNEPLQITPASDWIEVPDTQFALLHDAYARHQRVKKAFDAAVTHLRSFARSGPYSMNANSSRLFSYLHFLDECLEVGGLEFMSGWYAEKMNGIRNHFQRMMKRKQTNHPNYRYSEEYVTSNLFSFSAPPAWHSDPPEPPAELLAE